MHNSIKRSSLFLNAPSEKEGKKKRSAQWNKRNIETWIAVGRAWDEETEGKNSEKSEQSLD